MNLSLLRAALVAALSISATLSVAQSRPSKSETYKDLIEKAQNLVLQKDRQQALTILANATQRETRPAAVVELKKTASDIAHIFFSDKAQQLFETGVALRRTDLNQAYDKSSEALRIEPDNLSIVKELSRIMIAKADCKSALELVQKHWSLMSFDEELRLILAQSQVCLSRWADYQKSSEGLSSKRSPLQKFWLALEVEKNLAQKNLTKAQEAASTLKKTDDKYPESAYWSWKVSWTQKKSNLDEAQKYLMSCKNISANQYRQYMMDPALCRHLSEVESEQKGLHGAAE